MEQRTSMAEPIKKRLSMQNEILKRVEELSERMQRRAEEVTMEVRDLEGRASAAEHDLRGALDVFRHLSDTHFVENIILEADQSCAGDRGKRSVDRNIPAQSYEVDILPRYKEAVLLGLQSYEEHMKRANKRYTTRSTFNPWSVRGPLPHIIGSEEYIHDNSCGLIADLVFGTSPDFNDLEETKGTQADAEANDMFNPNLFGTDQIPAEEDANEPFVSAALDFKAMLEAALRSPYKFYDEETSSHVMESNDTWTACPEDMTQVPDIITAGSPRRLSDVDSCTIPIVGHSNSAEVSDILTNISESISGSLSHLEKTSPHHQGVSDNISDLVEGCAGETVSDTTNSTARRNLDPDNDSSERHCISITSSPNSEETVGQETSVEGLNQIEEDIACKVYTAFPDNVVRHTKSSSIDDESILNTSKESFVSKSYPAELETSSGSQASGEDAKERVSFQLSDDIQSCEISSFQAKNDSPGPTPQCSTPTGSDHDRKTDV